MKFEQVKFSDIQDRVQAELKKKLKDTPIPNEDGFAIIKGFMKFYLHKEISKDITTAVATLPMVAIVGNTSGRIYTYALKAILPDIEI